jgi:hypothetical protein
MRVTDCLRRKEPFGRLGRSPGRVYPTLATVAARQIWWRMQYREPWRDHPARSQATFLITARK